MKLIRFVCVVSTAVAIAGCQEGSLKDSPAPMFGGGYYGDRTTYVPQRPRVSSAADENRADDGGRQKYYREQWSDRGEKSDRKHLAEELPLSGKTLELAITPSDRLQVGKPYFQTAVTTGGSGFYTYSLSGRVPKGTVFSSETGSVSGTLADSENFNYSITVRDTRKFGLSATQTVTGRVVAADNCWETLDGVEVQSHDERANFRLKRARITLVKNLNKGGITQIRIAVKNRSVRVGNLYINYTDGTQETIAINQDNIEADSSYGPIELHSGDRVIASIEGEVKSNVINKKEGRGLWGNLTSSLKLKAARVHILAHSSDRQCN